MTRLSPGDSSHLVQLFIYRHVEYGQGQQRNYNVENEIEPHDVNLGYQYINIINIYSHYYKYYNII